MSTNANMVSVASREVERAIDLIDPSKSSRLKASFKQGTRKSLNIIRTSVRRGASAVTSNREKRNKGVSTKMYKSTLGGSVGINTSFKLSNGRWFGLYLLELGTSDVIGRNGKRHGATPAKPFFASAVRASMDKATDSLGNNIIAAIEKAAQKQ